MNNVTWFPVVPPAKRGELFTEVHYSGGGKIPSKALFLNFFKQDSETGIILRLAFKLCPVILDCLLYVENIIACSSTIL